MDFVKNQEIVGYPFSLINVSTGAVVLGASPVIYITKDGGAQATSTNAATEAGNGQYLITIAQAETNATVMGMQITETSSVAHNIPFHFTVKDVDTLKDFDPALDTVALVTDITTKTGFSLSAAGIIAIWDATITTLDTSTLKAWGFIASKLGLINAGAITLTGSTTSGDLIQLYQGGARTVASGNPILFNIDGTVTDLSGLTTRLAFQRVKASGGTDLLEVTGVVNDAGLSSQFVTFEVLSTDTAAMELDDDSLPVFLHTGGHAYDWTFSFGESAGVCPVSADGEASVKPKHTTCP